MRSFALTALIALLLPLAACGKPETPDALVDEMIAEYKRLPAIVGSVTDDASARKAVTELEGMQKKFQSLAERSQKTPEPANAQPGTSPLDKKIADAVRTVNADVAAKAEDLRKKDPAAAKLVGDALDKARNAIAAMRVK